MTIAVCESVAVFTKAAAFKALLMQSLGIHELWSQTFKSLRMEDRRRTENVTKKTSTKFTVNRKELRMKKKRKAGNSCDTFYKSVAFGLEAEPEVGDGAEKYQNRKRNKPEAEPVEVQDITFCDEKDIILTIEKRKREKVATCHIKWLILSVHYDMGAINRVSQRQDPKIGPKVFFYTLYG